MIKTHYAELLSDVPADKTKAEWLAARTWELTDFLVNVAGLDKIDARFEGSITYHDSCAGLREMGVKSQPRQLLAKVEGLTIREMGGAEECCGFGGTFAIKYGDISARLADLKCDDVTKSEADAVVLGDLGCMLNIEGRLRRRGDERTKVLHVAEVLAGLSGEEVG
jgi:L-lactate dehydrogenase complex protein LldE